MIFYTLCGPAYRLEIHEDKLKLCPKKWLSPFVGENILVWGFHELAEFKITQPKFLFWGKLHWVTHNGVARTYHFTTHPLMVKKIEIYLQKVIQKIQKIDKDSKDARFSRSQQRNSEAALHPPLLPL